MQDNVIAAGTDHTVAFNAKKIRDLFCPESGGIDHPPRFKVSSLRMQVIVTVFPRNSRDLVLKIELGAVCVRILGERCRIQERVHDAASL